MIAGCPPAAWRSARCDTGRKQGGDGPVDGPVAAASHLMQRAERQAAGGQPAIERGQSKRQHAARRTSTRLDTGDLRAERLEGWGGGGHVLLKPDAS